MSIKKNQIIAAMLLAVATMIGIAFGVIARQPGGYSAQELQAKLEAATLYPENFRALEPFRLADHDGHVFDNDRLQGNWSLIFFGFISCPDVCPLTLQILQTVHGEIAARGAPVPKVVFVSVDPERDTAGRLRQYVHHFHPEFIGVSGDHAELQALARNLGVFYSKTENPQQPDRYLVDHSASLFLLGPDGRIRALFSAPLQAGTITTDLYTIIQHG